MLVSVITLLMIRPNRPFHFHGGALYLAKMAPVGKVSVTLELSGHFWQQFSNGKGRFGGR